MTQLRLPIEYDTGVLIRDGGKTLPLLISFDTAGISLRQKGRRDQYVLPYRAAYDIAAKLRAEQERRERKGKGK